MCISYKLLAGLCLSVSLVANHVEAKDLYKCQDSGLLPRYKQAILSKEYNCSDDLLKALCMRPKGLGNDYEYAQIFTTFASEGFEASKKAAQIVIGKYPKRPEGHFWLGYVNLQQGNYVEAINCFKYAKMLDPKNYDIQQHLVYSYFFAKDYKACYAETLAFADFYESHKNEKNEAENIARVYLMGVISATESKAITKGQDLLIRMVNNAKGLQGDSCYLSMMADGCYLMAKRSETKNEALNWCRKGLEYYRSDKLFALEKNLIALNSNMNYTYKKYDVRDVELLYDFVVENDLGETKKGARYTYEKPVPPETTVFNDGSDFLVSDAAALSVSGSVYQLPSVTGAIIANQIRHNARNHRHSGRGGHHRH